MMLDELCTCPCKCLISHHRCIPGITNLTFRVASLHPLTVLPALSEGFGSGWRGNCAVPGAADGLRCMPTSSRAELRFCSWAMGGFLGAPCLSLRGNSIDFCQDLPWGTQPPFLFLWKGLLGKSFGAWQEV